MFNKNEQVKQSSLPYRQLRNSMDREESVHTSSLPYRQLRNSQVGAPMQTGGSLPYRQLRNYTGPDKRIKKEFTAVQAA
ncbi:TPA: hypothetical protein I8Y95_002082 [Legionella pneumophila]|nr:hypothetical protein [Legionella pneumophila]